MLTAMQELMAFCMGNSEKELLTNSVGNRDMIPMDKFYAKATELLEKERSIIIDAYDKGHDNAELHFKAESEKYYTDTFTNQ